MRWLILLAATAAAALLALAVASERRGGHSPRSAVARVASTTLSLVALGAGVYVAHWLGIFSVPLVALAFVPCGIVLRWWFMATRGSRERETAARAVAGGRRLPAAAELPIFVGLVALAVALGLIAGFLVGPH